MNRNKRVMFFSFCDDFFRMKISSSTAWLLQASTVLYVVLLVGTVLVCSTTRPTYLVLVSVFVRSSSYCLLDQRLHYFFNKTNYRYIPNVDLQKQIRRDHLSTIDHRPYKTD